MITEKPKGKLPANAEAIKNWILVNRKDLAPSIDALMESDQVILLTTIGFEAGRKFQQDNPTLPLGPSSYL